MCTILETGIMVRSRMDFTDVERVAWRSPEVIQSEHGLWGKPLIEEGPGG